MVVLEQDICGGGPSGRNGGFASGWWDELDGLITLYGEADAVRACRAISDSINAIGDFCSAHNAENSTVSPGRRFGRLSEGEMESSSALMQKPAAAR